MGPLAKVDTITAGINLDVERTLRMGPGKTLRLIVPDATQVSKWRTLATLESGFNRITSRERTAGDGSQVIWHIADPDEALDSYMTEKELHVECDGNVFSVGTVPPLAPNEAHVFVLTCKSRTLRIKFFDNSR